MPIQEKDLGKYVRPGIYIEETNSSTITTPPLQNVLINLVPGFSKKGPFNYPVYIETPTAFETTFGTIDYQLERKGSYFHRTCLKMLETGPIWALNLLDTISGRDKLNYVSVSTTSKYDSSDLSKPFTADYELFFNRQDFWEKDTETFLDLIKSEQNDVSRLLHLTNMGDKAITVFLFKSNATNFDVTAEVWYNGETKVPSYIHPKSLISDYLVTVLILEGNWNDYKKLSVDSKWSKYFTTDGLQISTITNFLNESSVSVLGNYDASLIPEFQDLNSRNMFIETVINDSTNSTSLFCAYNKDLLLDSDYLSDLVDMVGFTLVGSDKESINFLSYNQDLKEIKSYDNVSLDAANNVFAVNTIGIGDYGTSMLNWCTDGIIFSEITDNSQVGVAPLVASTLKIEAIFPLSNASYIINGAKYTINGEEKRIILDNIAPNTERTDIIYLDSDGFQVEKGIASISGETILREINFNNNNTIILGTVKIINDTETTNYYYNEVSVNGSGFVTLPVEFGQGIDNIGEFLSVVFTYTDVTRILSSNSDYYKQLRASKYYTELSSNIATNKGVIVKLSGAGKESIIDPISIPGTSLSLATVNIYISNPTNYLNGAIYYIDNEFNYVSGNVMTTAYDTMTNVVSKYSALYLDYINGEINNGDYILKNGVKDALTMFVDANGIMTLTFDFSPEFLPLDILSDIGNWKETIQIDGLDVSFDPTNTLSIKMSKERYPEVKVGMYIEAYYDEAYYSNVGEGFSIGDYTPRKLVRVISVKNDVIDTTLKNVFTDGPIKITKILDKEEYYTTMYPAIYQYATHLKGANLIPFKLNIDSIPNGTEARLNTILNVMGQGTQMFKGLVNKNKISWRYLVDSFGLGLSENSKQQYLDICGKKLNCLGFINMPSVKDFKKSYNPSYVDEYGAFSTVYLKDGANLDKNPNFLYTFGEGVGGSTVGYFFPYVTHTVDGVTKEVPPAAFAATAYMRKQLSNSSATYPWTIVAGVNDGIISGMGKTEIDFTDDDLTNLAQMGVNPITFVRKVGYIINDESTASVFPISSLSYIHSREVLIELENDLYDMLLRYQWKFNTPGIRSEIKYKADTICRGYVEKGGLYAFRNVIDISNNTNYIIDLQGGVLDTHVEIVKGMGWIVNNITIEKTGTITSTGFGA